MRNVTANGPVQKMFVAYPPTDGQVVDDSYVMKVWFSKSLADGTTTQDLINRFLIKIASSESGSGANGVAQPQSGLLDQLRRHFRLSRARLPAPESLQRPARFPPHD